MTQLDFYESRHEAEKKRVREMARNLTENTYTPHEEYELLTNMETAIRSVIQSAAVVGAARNVASEIIRTNR